MPMVDIYVWREGYKHHTGTRYERTPKKVRGKAIRKAMKRQRMKSLKAKQHA